VLSFGCIKQWGEHLIADFTLTNEDAQATSLADLTNHVWVADIIFTRCAGPCPRMTTQMKSVQNALPQNSETRLVTLTTDPDYDSPEILKRYGERSQSNTIDCAAIALWLVGCQRWEF
jgi:protein SCO1/2